MAEDKVESRETSWRQLLPWTILFRGFQIALDLNKLLLAAAGIFVTALGWSILAFLFSLGSGDPTQWPSNYESNYPEPNRAWTEFKRDRDQWNIMYEASGYGKERAWDVGDLAESPKEYDAVTEAVQKKTPIGEALAGLVKGGTITEGQAAAKAAIYRKYLDQPKRAGTLATWPWFEDRGPNPYLLVTGQSGIPWEPGHFWEWFSREQAPVMVEPIIKMMRPIVYFLNPHAGFWARLYFLLVALWTLAVWSLFGGAITRIAVIQVARGEKIGLTEAFRFALKRLISFVSAPLFPLAFVFVLLVFMWIFGLFHMIPYIGDILVSGLFWPVMIAFGLGMAIALVGLVGWPLMPATISAEGTDSWEAVSRSYSYVYQRPWQYIWYGLVAIAYGGVLVFFIGFIGSFSVYLSKWGVSRTPGIERANREPSFLFVYAPTSFGWRTLMLQGVKVDGANVVENGKINENIYDQYINKDGKRDDKQVLTASNKIGASLVAFWLGLLFLLILGFGYSYFWSAATIIYLLLRKQVDAAELDEVHLEEEDEGGFGAPSYTSPPATPARNTGTPLAMVEAPSLKAPVPPPAPPPSAPPPSVPPSPPPGDSATPPA